MSKWIRKDDRVVVIAGNDKGKVGTVLGINRENSRVVVSGVNVRKKHLKRTQENQPPQIIEMERAVNLSNVALADAEGKAIYPKVRSVADSGKELYYLNEKGKDVVLRQIKKKRG